MATFTTKQIVDELMNRGHDNDGERDIPIQRVVEYETPEAATVWGVVYPGERIDRYNVESPYVRNPRTIWPPDQT